MIAIRDEIRKIEDRRMAGRRQPAQARTAHPGRHDRRLGSRPTRASRPCSRCPGSPRTSSGRRSIASTTCTATATCSAPACRWRTTPMTNQRISSSPSSATTAPAWSANSPPRSAPTRATGWNPRWRSWPASSPASSRWPCRPSRRTRSRPRARPARRTQGHRRIGASAQKSAPTGRRLKLGLVGHDRIGIVREVSQVLAHHAVNVEDLATHTASAPMSADMLFHCRRRTDRRAGPRCPRADRANWNASPTT